MSIDKKLIEKNNDVINAKKISLSLCNVRRERDFFCCSDISGIHSENSGEFAFALSEYAGYSCGGEKDDQKHDIESQIIVAGAGIIAAGALGCG